MPGAEAAIVFTTGFLYWGLMNYPANQIQSNPSNTSNCWAQFPSKYDISGKGGRLVGNQHECDSDPDLTIMSVKVIASNKETAKEMNNK